MTGLPQHVNSDSWYYEEKEEITVVIKSGGGSVGAEMTTIPWGMVRTSLRRKDKKKLAKWKKVGAECCLDILKSQGGQLYPIAG